MIGLNGEKIIKPTPNGWDYRSDFGVELKGQYGPPSRSDFGVELKGKCGPPSLVYVRISLDFNFAF